LASAVFGSETTSFAFTALDSTDPITLAAVAVNGAAPYAVRLAAHLYVQGASFDANSRYDFGICRGDASGPLVGRSHWRPGRIDSDGNYIGDAVTFTGFDTGLAGPTIYVLCGEKFDATAPNVDVFMRGLVATVPEPSAALSALVAAASLGVSLCRRGVAGSAASRRARRAGSACRVQRPSGSR
jgi:hypothetical protein